MPVGVLTFAVAGTGPERRVGDREEAVSGRFLSTARCAPHPTSRNSEG
jgi:hypothetical protein